MDFYAGLVPSKLSLLVSLETNVTASTNARHSRSVLLASLFVWRALLPLALCSSREMEALIHAQIAFICHVLRFRRGRVMVRSGGIVTNAVGHRQKERWIRKPGSLSI